MMARNVVTEVEVACEGIVIVRSNKGPVARRGRVEGG